MKKIKKAIGATLIATPFVVYFAALFHAHGAEGVLIIVGSILLFIGVTYVGVKLFYDL